MRPQFVLLYIWVALQASSLVPLSSCAMQIANTITCTSGWLYSPSDLLETTLNESEGPGVSLLCN